MITTVITTYITMSVAPLLRASIPSVTEGAMGERVIGGKGAGSREPPEGGGGERGRYLLVGCSEL